MGQPGRVYSMTTASADNLIITPESSQWVDLVYLTDGFDGPGLYGKKYDGTYEPTFAPPIISGYFEDGGNHFGHTAVLGTTDNYGLNFITHNTLAGFIDTNQNFSFGAISIDSNVRVTISGTDASSAFYALIVGDNNLNNLFTVRNDGFTVVGNGNPNIFRIFDDTANIGYVVNSTDIYGTTQWTNSLTDTSGVNSINYGSRLLEDSTGATSINWNTRLFYNPVGSVCGGWSYNSAGPGAQIALLSIGIDTTSSNYSFLAQDSINADLFCIRNDGFVGVGTIIPTYQLTVINAGNSFTDKVFGLESDFVGNLMDVRANNSFGFGTTAIDTVTIAAQTNGGTAFGVVGASSLVASLGFFFTAGGSLQLFDSTGATELVRIAPAGGGFNNWMYFSGNLEITTVGGIGLGGVPEADSMVRIGCADSSSAFYSMVSQNTSGNYILRLRNDGVVLMETLPTSSVGLPSGAIWNNAGVLNIV